MKTKSIRISYPEMKTQAILQASKEGDSIEEIAIKGLDAVYQKDVAKPVRDYIDSMIKETPSNNKTDKPIPNQLHQNQPIKLAIPLIPPVSHDHKIVEIREN